MHWLILLLAGLIHAQTFSATVLPASLLAPIQVATLAVLFFYVLRSDKVTTAVRFALVFALANFCAGIYWLFISMNTYGRLVAPVAATAVFLLSLYLSIYPMLAVAAFKKLKVSSGVFAAVLLASTWSLAEWLRATVMTGFPWLNIAYAHSDSPLGAWASVWGAYGVAFLAALCAGLIALYFTQKSWTQFKPLLIVGIVLLSGQAIKLIPWSSPINAPISVRLVQGNIDQHDKFRPTKMFHSMMDNFELARLPAGDDNNPPSVVIFPETIIPSFQHQVAPELWHRIIQDAAQQNATYIIGTPYFAQTDNLTEPFIANSVIVIDGNTTIDAIYNNNGVPRYDKQHLVPFGEYIPYGFKWFVHAIGIPMGDFNRGATRQANFTLEGQNLAANICYEDIFGEELLPALFTQQGNAGATILFNVSNLAWFGNSSALGQHLQIAKMRTIETARPMLRATNTGATAYINEKGIVIASLPFLSAGVLDVAVQGMTGFTPYTYVGNYLFLAYVIFLLLLAILKLCQRRKIY